MGGISMNEKQISTLNKKDFSYIQLDFPFAMASAYFCGKKRWMSPIWPKPHSASLKYMPIGSTFHYHAHYEFIYVLDGTFTQHLENSIYCLNAGDATILNSKIRHCEGDETDCNCIYINISPDFLYNLLYNNPADPKHSQHKSSDILQLCHGTIDFPSTQTRASLDFRRTLQGKLLSDTQNIDNPKSIIREIINVLSDCSWGYAFSLQGLLLKLFSALENPENFHITHVHTDSNTETVLFAEIQHYVKERNGRISRNELSSLLHYNPDYLGRVIKQQSGMSFLQYCQSIWLEKAKKLLCTTDMSVIQIIKLLNFENKNNFYRVFLASTGMTPIEYRQQNQPQH
jgi:AraC-like DNA-binding protein